jgi:hypothetical protein
MIMLTGAGISIIVIAMAINTALRSIKEIKKMRIKGNGE